MTASDVLVGIEFEFEPSGTYSEEWVDCYCDDPYCDGSYLESEYGDDPHEWVQEHAVRIHGMVGGTDCGNVEYRSDGPTPLADAALSMAEFVRWLNHQDGVELHQTTGVHVHINCRPETGPSVDPDHLWTAYDEMREEFYDLCESSDRRDNEYARVVDEPSAAHFADFSTRHLSEYSYGTVELRGWDSTLSERLTGDRMRFLAKLIDRAQQLEAA